MEEEIIKQNNELSRNLKTRTKKKKDDFKEKECSVINYNNSLKTLDINFDDMYEGRLSKFVAAFVRKNSINENEAKELIKILEKN